MKTSFHVMGHIVKLFVLILHAFITFRAVTAEHRHDEIAYCGKIESMQSFRMRRLPPRLVDEDSYDLENLFVFTRHGARTPTSEIAFHSCLVENTENIGFDCSVYSGNIQGSTNNPMAVDNGKNKGGTPRYVSSPYFLHFDHPEHNVFNGTCYSGQLISEGVDQLKALGTMLAERYLQEGKRLFNPEDISTEIFFRSTNVPRTLASGVTLLDSFLSSQPYRDAANKASVKLHTRDLVFDSLYSESTSCPNLEELTLDALKGLSRDKLLKAYQPAHKKLCKILSCPKGYESLFHHDHLFDCFQTTVCRGYQSLLHDGLKTPIGSSYKPDPDRELYKVLLDSYVEEIHDFYSFNSGAISKCMMNNFLLSLKESIVDPKYKMHYYSCHDTTLFPIIVSLIQDFVFWPEYASLLIFEVWSKDGAKFVRVAYNGKILTPMIKECRKYQELCPIDTFLKALSFATELHPLKRVPRWGKGPIEKQLSGTNRALLIAVSILGALGAFAIIVYVVFFTRKCIIRKKPNSLLEMS